MTSHLFFGRTRPNVAAPRGVLNRAGAGLARAMPEARPDLLLLTSPREDVIFGERHKTASKHRIIKHLNPSQQTHKQDSHFKSYTVR
jgi:hypothetical protein